MAKNSDRAGGGQTSGMGFVLALAALTLLGGGAGALFGLQMSAATDPAGSAVAADGGTDNADASAKTREGSASGKLPAKGAGAADLQSNADGSGGTTLVTLNPIFANLAEPRDVWIRLEAALMVKPDIEQRDVLIAKVSQDVVQFLRTVKLAQLEDSSGLQFLRDDLNDIVRSRSDGQITELLIKGLIVE